MFYNMINYMLILLNIIMNIHRIYKSFGFSWDR